MPVQYADDVGGRLRDVGARDGRCIRVGVEPDSSKVPDAVSAGIVIEIFMEFEAQDAVGIDAEAQSLGHQVDQCGAPGRAPTGS